MCKPMNVINDAELQYLLIKWIRIQNDETFTITPKDILNEFHEGVIACGSKPELRKTLREFFGVRSARGL